MAKAEYLLTRIGEPGKGGDKQNYWKNILGFQSAEAVRQAILAEVTLETLHPEGKHPYGDRLVAIIQVSAPTGRSQAIRTIWLMPFGAEVARFITAFPDHQRN